MLNIKDRLYIATFQINALEVAAQYGVGIEFNHTCISQDLDDENRSRLLHKMKSDLAAAGAAGTTAETSGTAGTAAAAKATLHGPFTEIHPAAIDYRFRDLAKQRLNQAFEICSALSVKNMIVHSGWVPFIYFKEWQAKRGAEFWQDFMADKPEDFNIYVENVMEDEPYMMADFMSHVTDSRIRLCLDIGHANAATSKDIAIETWIKVLGPYIGHFHLHNNDGTGDAHGDFESGTMDMVSIFNTIENYCRPDTTFTIEARQCGKCMEWLQNHRYI